VTIFERLIAREIPAEILHEDDQCVAFRDINAQAPTHFLVVPKIVIPRLGEALPEHKALLGHLLLTAATVARQLGLAASGFRVVINHGPDGGETVPHLHVHVLGGRAMTWPPG
jgi:histidine triad (HIT) family protein